MQYIFTAPDWGTNLCKWHNDCANIRKWIVQLDRTDIVLVDYSTAYYRSMNDNSDGLQIINATGSGEILLLLHHGHLIEKWEW